MPWADMAFWAAIGGIGGAACAYLYVGVIVPAVVALMDLIDHV